MKFKLIGGRHSACGVTYKAGDIVESASDLTITFKNKFVKVEDEASAVDTDTITTPETPDSTTEEPDTTTQQDTTADAATDAENVTADFPIAVKNKLKVMKLKGWYNIYDEEEDDALVNEKGLREAAVEAAIEDYLDDED